MKELWKRGIIGILTGFANGLFGSGGGTIVVPAMERILGVETHKAHATAVAIILPLSVLSAFLYKNAGDLDWQTILWVSAGGVAGGFVGAKLLNRFSSKWLNKIFGAFMIVAAVRMIF